MTKLTIYYTSDTHGYLYDTSFASSDHQDIGLLGFHFPKDGNTLVMDGGDTIQGSPLTYYCHAMEEPLPIAQAMNDRGYDYVTLGNHDFNYGPSWLLQHLSGLNAQCLCANVEDLSGTLPVLPWKIHVLENGLRIGIIGIVTDWINLWEKPQNLVNLRISDPLAAARDALEDMKKIGYDVLVGIYHGGVERDLDSGVVTSPTSENIACALCEAIPFDLLLTGHQHIAMVEKTWHHTHIVQTSCNARLCVKITMDENHAFSSEFVYPDFSLPLTSAQHTLRQKLEAWLDQPIGSFSHDMWPGGKLNMAIHGSPIADFFNTVMLWASQADIACSALPNELRGFSSHVTVRDVVASYPYPNTLVVLQVTGKVIRDALEQCARYFAVDQHGCVHIAQSFLEPKEEHYNYDYFSGIQYTFDLSRSEGNRVVSLKKDGREIHDKDSYTLVMTNYRATGTGNFAMYPQCRVIKTILTDMCELLLEYIHQHPYTEVSLSHPISVTGYSSLS